LGLLAATWLVAMAGGADCLLRALWPAVVAVGVVILLRQAVVGLAFGVAAGALLLAGGQPVEALRLALAEHIFPAVQGPWRVGALVFTLVLGAFAGVLERAGGFEALLRRWVGDRGGQRRLLGGVYGMGLVCFFDGLASSMLTGRIARPLADRAGISREKLAWVVDTTASPIACVAFISTWIATQLSLIEQGLVGAAFEADPYEMFFRSVVANPYCLLCLLLVPLAIWLRYEPRAMRRFAAMRPEAGGVEDHGVPTAGWRVLVPLVVLVTGIVAGFPLLAEERVDVLTVAGWREAFSGSSGPFALVAGSLLGLAAAFAFFPKGRAGQAGEAAVQGAGSLLPALVVLVLAWSLGSQFQALGAADLIAQLLMGGAGAAWLPLAVFAVASAMAFATGSSWGTMGIMMPLALGAAVAAGWAGGMEAADARALAAMTIGAVFGGATLGDHCSPFSDTTIVSALASGCRTVDHVVTQLPLAGMVAGMAALAYTAMAAGVPAAGGTALAALVLGAWVFALSRRKGEAVGEGKSAAG
jgi:tetracycline resistance efflux pump